MNTCSLSTTGIYNTLFIFHCYYANALLAKNYCRVHIPFPFLHFNAWMVGEDSYARKQEFGWNTTKFTGLLEVLLAKHDCLIPDLTYEKRIW